MDLNLITLHPAGPDDIEDLRNLINLAYRGEKGWTRETDIISGERIGESQLRSILSDIDRSLLICRVDEQLVACVCVENQEDGVYIGTFSVHPNFQGLGVGNRVLSLAEEFALAELKATRFLMLVVSGRDELVAYYERRGYRRTGVFKPYPENQNVGSPKTAGMQIEKLEKPVHTG